MNVEIQRFGDLTYNRPAHSVAASGTDPYRDPLRGDIFRNRVAREITIPRRIHLVLCGQIQPKLKSFHQAIYLLRDFGMNHTATGSHPLHTAASQ